MGDLKVRKIHYSVLMIPLNFPVRILPRTLFPRFKNRDSESKEGIQNFLSLWEEFDKVDPLQKADKTIGLENTEIEI